MRDMLLGRLMAASAVLLVASVVVAVVGEWPHRIQAGSGRPGNLQADGRVEPPTSPPPEVVVRDGGRKSGLLGGPRTYAEGMVLALLGKSNFDLEADVTGEMWSKSLREDHFHVSYPKPRRVTMTVRVAGFGEPFEDREIEISEIIIPLPADDSPQVLYVQSGERRRGFTKFDGEEFKLLRRYVKKSLPEDRPPSE